LLIAAGLLFAHGAPTEPGSATNEFIVNSFEEDAATAVM
jgi:hypothetical protein